MVLKNTQLNKKIDIQVVSQRLLTIMLITAAHATIRHCYVYLAGKRKEQNYLLFGSKDQETQHSQLNTQIKACHQASARYHTNHFCSSHHFTIFAILLWQNGNMNVSEVLPR